MGADNDNPEPGLEVRGLTKSFGARREVPVLQDLSFRVGRGEFVSLLGPSGCGKTTTLNLIAGFLSPDAGDVIIGERVMTQVPTHRRDIALVFQNYSLFPHMTVGQNVSFGLKMRSKTRLSKVEMAERVQQMLELVQMPDMAARYPHELSGGQQQRVGLARCLAVNPGVLLLDEPLSNLDAKLRKAMQVELREIISAVKATTVYVTHDQEEALSMSDRVIVMNHGRIEQAGRPDQIYGRPETEFVADFVGEANHIAAELVEHHGGSASVRLPSGHVVKAVPSVPVHQGDDLIVVVRPERVSAERLPRDAALDDPLTGTVAVRSYIGSYIRLEVDTDKDGRLAATMAVSEAAHFSVGDHVRLRFDPADCIVLKRS